MAEYNQGTTVVLIATFRDEDGQLTDPDPVIFRYRAPDGTLTTQTRTVAVPGTDITRVSQGVYRGLVPLDQAGGYYAWHWYGLMGDVESSQESTPDTALKVRTTGFPP